MLDQKTFEVLFNRLVDVKEDNVSMSFSIKQKPRCLEVMLSPLNPFLNAWLHKARYPL
jgi:hypothetical protein